MHGLIGISRGCKAVAEPCKAHKHLVFTLVVYGVMSSHWLNYGLITTLSLHYPTVTVALLSCVPLEGDVTFSRWAHRSYCGVWGQALCPGGTDESPWAVPTKSAHLKVVLPWAGRKTKMWAGSNVVSQSCVGSSPASLWLSAVSRIAPWKPRDVRKKWGWGHHIGSILKLQRFLNPHFSQSNRLQVHGLIAWERVSPCIVITDWSPREGDFSCCGSSQLYSNRALCKQQQISSFGTQLAPCRAFSLPLTAYYKVSGVPVVTPFAQRRIWQNRIFLEMSVRGGCRPRPLSCAANLEMDVTIIHCPPFFAHPAWSSSAQESSPLWKTPRLITSLGVQADMQTAFSCQSC